MFAVCLCGFAQTPRSPPPEGGRILRQEENNSGDAPVQSQRWNLFYQATSIGQYHGRFNSRMKEIIAFTMCLSVMFRSRPLCTLLAPG